MKYSSDYQGFVGAVCAAMREERGIPQANFSEICGLPQPCISRLERGKANFTITTLRAIAYGLSSTPAKILQEAERVIDLDLVTLVETPKGKDVPSGFVLGRDLRNVLEHLLEKQE